MTSGDEMSIKSVKADPDQITFVYKLFCNRKYTVFKGLLDKKRLAKAGSDSVG